MTAELAGTVTAGVLGEIPLIRCTGQKPPLRNNGYNEFSGVPLLHVPGLADALPDEGRCIRQGHVMLRWSDGGEFLTYASTTRGDDKYLFS